jgi:predicted negative regulator of RcsB-dependent stress response
MTKPMAREKRPQSIDTEDHVTERVLEAAAWAETHRRAVVAGAVALVAVVAAGFYYQDYRQKLVERASVRLQEIQISAQNADAGALRSELRLFIDQFSGTLYANQARVALAEIELQRDSLGAAIRVLEPVADLGTGDPLAFTAAGMIGAAYEQAGEPARALRWYERIESNAVFGHQRRAAVAEQARMQMAAGRYAEAITLYETLVAETVDDPGGQQIYSVRLGEARARERFAAAAPVLPIVDGAASVPEGSDGAEEGAGEEPGDTGE